MRVVFGRAGDEIRGQLLRWFSSHRRDLPWRRTQNPYAIWISEVMLQQTQVVTVIPYWHRFMERFPDVATLANAELPDVFAMWRGLGYYSRARNLHRAAKEIVEHHGGVLPATSRELRRLPGFGRYTAGAVASIAFDEETPIVEGNVARVLSRVFEISGPPGDRTRESLLWQIAGELVGGPQPRDFNQALMELGATVCRSNNPSCPRCPIQRHCGALRSNRVRELPPPRVRPERRSLRLAVAVCRRGGKVLVARRPEGGLFGGLWELPSVEVADRVGMKRIANALGDLLGPIRLGALVGSVKRKLTHRNLTIDLFEARGRIRTRPGHGREWRWIVPSEAASLGMSTAMAHALAVVSTDE